jgi:hypothetical protein
MQLRNLECNPEYGSLRVNDNNGLRQRQQMTSLTRRNLTAASTRRSSRQVITLLLAIVLSVGLGGCGSTKVYTADKTIVYQDSVYNVSNVKIFTRKSTGTLADGSTVNLANMEEQAFMEILAASPTVKVRQEFLLDEAALVYREMQISSWKEFKKLSKQFSSASKDLNKFLADSKKTQLKLK